ncbi:MAG: DUF1592 domain-containing protein [Nannocystaceae bacterium]|nr:DUF1592 domain-containing protein [Nannocystaceae bacterium]
MIPRSITSIALLTLCMGCYQGLNVDAAAGDDSPGPASEGSASSGGTGDDTSSPPDDASQVPFAGLRRLTAAEHDATLRDLIGDELGDSVLFLPEDPRTPFDNDYTTQTPAQSLVSGADLLASDAAARLVADAPRLATVVGCQPNGPDDAECFESFVRTFGRRAFRRPLSDDEVEQYMEMAAFAVERDDFNEGVEAALRAMLSAPSFLYRVEIGEPVDGVEGVFALEDYEVATRLSYFLWGTTPSDELLDEADAGRLSSPDGVATAVGWMMEDERALDRVTRFHALWLGYERLPGDYELVAAMESENRALMQRVIFDEQRPWQDVLRLEETYASDLLASHYGIPLPGSETPQWTSYGDTGRKGLLSGGSFLSIGQKFGDTSPTQRGLLIRTRLFCMNVPPPSPDLNVDVDEPPGDPENECKWERYAAHREEGSACAACHALFDPIGFGLEAYGPLGELRTHEPGKPECEVYAQGNVAEAGDFSGPGELADRVLESGAVNRCVSTQLYRFAMGRYELDEADLEAVKRLTENLGDGDFRFDTLVEELVASDAFLYRRTKEI